jgi:hypothetical protein
VSWVFPPHRSQAFVVELARALDLPLARFVLLPNESRDYFTSSLAATLEAAFATSLVRPGDIGLLIAAGAGVQVGCATYHFGSNTSPSTNQAAARQQVGPFVVKGSHA